MGIIRKVDSILTKTVAWIATVAFIGVAFCVTLGVIARLINVSIPWTEEMSRYCLIWFVYTAAMTGHQYVEDTCVDVLFQRFPSWAKVHIRNLYRILMILFLLLVMRYGMDYAILGLKKRMVTLPVPIFWVRLAIPLGCILMSVKWVLLIILSYDKTLPEAER